MQIVLTAVNTKFIHTNPAVYSLRASAGFFREQISVLEFTINQRIDDMLDCIYNKKPDLLAFSCYLWNIEIIEKLLRECKKLLPDCKIWLGGPEAEASSIRLLNKYPELEGIMNGEGEETLKELAEHNGFAIEKIAGLIYCENKNGSTAVITTEPRPQINMDSLVFPYEDELLNNLKNKILYYESSRGCPFRCSYCLSSNETGVRYKSIEKVKSELQLFLSKQVRQVKFVDRTFNCNPIRTCDILSFLLENDNGVTNVHFEIAGDLLTDEEYNLLKQFRPGAVQLEIGVQTTNPSVLHIINRTSDMEMLYKNIERLVSLGTIHIHLDLIAGLPNETWNSFCNSFNQVYRLKPSQLQLGFLKVLGNTQMSEEASKYGIEYREYPPFEVLKTDAISYQELQELKHIEDMVEIYYNSGQFVQELLYAEHFFNSPYELYKKISEEYCTSFCSGEQSSRLARYIVLINVLMKCDELRSAERERIVKQLATFDCYSRERMKARPEFAVNEKETKWLKTIAEENDTLCKLDYKKENHIEYFDIDVPSTARYGIPINRSCAAVFYYERRSAINQNAEVELYDVDLLPSTVL